MSSDKNPSQTDEVASNVVREYLRRNADFVTSGSFAGLGLSPSRRTMIICCVDPRVDPTTVLGVRLGEAAVIRNVGGRVTPATLKTMAMLGRVGKANGDAPGEGWNLLVLHHTDCGITDLVPFPELLAEYFEISENELPAKAVTDPYASVDADVHVLKDTPTLPGGFTVTGLVYDVDTGRVNVAVPSAPLRR